MTTEAFHFFVTCLAEKIQKLKERRYAKLIQLRREHFVSFSAEYIAEKDYGLSTTYFPPSFPAAFDFFVVGGDQIWNPFFNYTKVPESVCFLPFLKEDRHVLKEDRRVLKEEKRAFMLSTSFGVSKDAFFARVAEIPGLLEAYRGALSRMRYITCREDAGAEITRSLAGKGEVLIDPAMMLTPEDWLGLARKPGFLSSRLDGKRGYVLTCFLGDFPRSLKKKIKKACENENLALVALNDFTDSAAYVTGPAGFVYLAANARTVYTDSFHGAVFSILFEVPFFAFERLGYEIDMLSRMDTLLRKFVLEDRLVKDVMGFCPPNGDFSLDFSQTRKILSREREKAIRFLKTAIAEMERLNPASPNLESPNAEFR
jgi:hypothetical protein